MKLSKFINKKKNKNIRINNECCSSKELEQIFKVGIPNRACTNCNIK